MKHLMITALVSSLTIASYADDHGAGLNALPEKPSIFAQIQPAQYQPGKGLSDVVAWGEDFAEVVEENGTPFRTTTWTPFYSNMAALPDIAQFDTLTLQYLGENHHRYSSIRVWGSIGFILMMDLIQQC